jgi:hypothetical protein
MWLKVDLNVPRRLATQQEETMLPRPDRVAVGFVALGPVLTHDEKIFDRFDGIFMLRDGWLAREEETR